MKRFVLLILVSISPYAPAREAQLPDPETLHRLQSGEVILETTRTDESGGAARVVMFSKAPVEAIWKVIFSCEQAFIFLDGLKICEVLENNSEYTITRQVVKKGWLIPRQDFAFRTLQAPYKHIEFRLVEGNLKAMEGSWDFIVMPQGVVVMHEIWVQPEVPAPRFIVRRLMRRGMPEMMACVRGLAGGSVSIDMEARDLGHCPGEIK
jgi:ribosome-associated toxin RatA of RatAB toxin-antitoxin module